MNFGFSSFLKWYRKYGEVYTYWITEIPIVAICGHEKMIETFQKDGEAYAGRFTFEEFNRLIRGKLYSSLLEGANISQMPLYVMRKST